jgi:hypothetical protein
VSLDLAGGSVIAQHYRRHRHQEFLRFLKLKALPGPPSGAGLIAPATITKIAAGRGEGVRAPCRLGDD